jgi:release factor glutamine methyltransferase
MVELQRKRRASGGTRPVIMETIKMAAEYLEKRGVDSARLGAELLLAKVLACSRMDLYMRFDRTLDEGALSAYRDLLRKRAEHYPLQYLIGTVEFFSLSFAVREGVFIPRPETELIVELVEEVFAGREEVRFLEFGVGSGVIAGSLASRHAGWRGFAFDKSMRAVCLAKENLEQLGVAERVSIFAADGFGAVGVGGKFDLLVSNPPYIPTQLIGTLQEEVSVHEDHSSLDGGSDGLAWYPLLARSGSELLKPGGMIALEIGDGQGGDVSSILSSGGYERVEVRRDYNRLERLIAAFRPNP